MKRVNFAMLIHNHQPVGNLEYVMEDAYARCYQPLLEVLSEFPEIPVSLHFSGVLLEWLIDRHPEYIEMAADAVSRGQIEIVGGTFGEAILTMIPHRDKRGQIAAMNDLVEKTFGTRPRGFWLPERVWEQSLASDLADAGVEYVCVDDSHFRFAGVPEHALRGYYITEDQGRTLKVFPGNERLRYLVPFHEGEEAIEFLKEHAVRHGERIVVYADDGEKFGVWPGTHELVFAQGWLRRFLSGLSENSQWLQVMTCGRAAAEFVPAGVVSMPDASYREMMQWALPAERHSAMASFVGSLKSADLYDSGRFFVRGGIWRNFQCKYPEARQMYGKMMYVSGKVERMSPGLAREEALGHLYRGQCNCAYWHGVFGGLYLPHLRYAAYQQLIAAEVLADSAGAKGPSTSPSHDGARGKAQAAKVDVVDIDFDGCDEVVLANDVLWAGLKPTYGGHLFELDIRAKNFNCLATLTRRRESYHEIIETPPEPHPDGVGSIHDRRAFKTDGLAELLDYDWYKREGLIDHFLPQDVTLEAFSRAKYTEFGDFVNMPYEWEHVTSGGRAGIRMKRLGGIWRDEQRTPVLLTKTIALREDECGFDADYEVTNASDEELSVVFGVEFNFAMLTGSADDRFYHAGNRSKGLGGLASRLDLAEVGRFCIYDGWQDIDIVVCPDVPARVWTFPVTTVSQSESGFESIYQCSAVTTLWSLSLSPGELWRVSLSVTAAYESA